MTSAIWNLLLAGIVAATGWQVGYALERARQRTAARYQAKLEAIEAWQAADEAFFSYARDALAVLKSGDDYTYRKMKDQMVQLQFEAVAAERRAKRLCARSGR